jgi:hypothetical protein
VFVKTITLIIQYFSLKCNTHKTFSQNLSAHKKRTVGLPSYKFVEKAGEWAPVAETHYVATQQSVLLFLQTTRSQLVTTTDDQDA